MSSPELVFDNHIQIRKIHVSFKESKQWGPKQSHYFVESPNKIAVLPFDPYTNTVIFTEEFSIGTYKQREGLWHLQIPSCVVSQSKAHAITIQQALSNTIQCESLDNEFIADFYTSPGLSNEQIFLYCAGIDSSQIEQNDHIEILPLSEAMDAIYGNYFQDASTIMSLHWLSANQERLQKKWQ